MKRNKIILFAKILHLPLAILLTLLFLPLIIICIISDLLTIPYSIIKQSEQMICSKSILSFIKEIIWVIYIKNYV